VPANVEEAPSERIVIDRTNVASFMLNDPYWGPTAAHLVARCKPICCQCTGLSRI